MAERRRLGQIDLRTGEVLENGFVAVLIPRRKNGFQEGWIAMAQDPLLALAKADLGDQARRVLFAVLGRLDFQNWIQLDQAELATEIGMQGSNFNRAIRKLEKEGVLLRGPKVGRSVTYRLNPTYGWKGSAKSHQSALEERMKAAGLSVLEGGGELPPSGPGKAKRGH